MPAVRKYRRDTSEVSCCLKYVIFGFNVMFWWLGLGIMAVGVWAWTEKDTFNNLSRLTNVALDPAFILILVGTVTFIIGFTGCVGALRENTCLLAAYAIFLALLLLMEMAAGVLGFVFKDWIKSQATGGFQAFIIHYREDPDQQNLIDWIQEDWEIIKNKQCGYDVRKPSYTGERSIYERGCLRAGEEWLELNLVPVAGTVVSTMVLQNFEVAKVIYEKGCVQAGEEWVERNLLAIVTGAVGTAFAQILGICFAQNLRADIFAQKAKWH
ncbi:tetraspanin-5 isoform X6 [Ceratina calcarata]|uniref:Tetraspanin-5 isoform X6 n=1 Tax=Ceratina calcarata TaxID=156304 RepID=A0AAJ7WF67_9HYME|nr:tetraspanin-5 isoform X6 [Ceratina calcarata]